MTHSSMIRMVWRLTAVYHLISGAVLFWFTRPLMTWWMGVNEIADSSPRLVPAMQTSGVYILMHGVCHLLILLVSGSQFRTGHNALTDAFIRYYSLPFHIIQILATLRLSAFINGFLV